MGDAKLHVIFCCRTRRPTGVHEILRAVYHSRMAVINVEDNMPMPIGLLPDFARIPCQFYHEIYTCKVLNNDADLFVLGKCSSAD